MSQASDIEIRRERNAEKEKVVGWHYKTIRPFPVRYDDKIVIKGPGILTLALALKWCKRAKEQ